MQLLYKADATYGAKTFIALPAIVDMALLRRSMFRSIRLIDMRVDRILVFTLTTQ